MGLTLRPVRLPSRIAKEWHCHAPGVGVRCAVLSPDGTLLITAGTDSTVCLTPAALKDGDSVDEEHEGTVAVPLQSCSRTLLSTGNALSLDVSGCVSGTLSSGSNEKLLLAAACDDSACKVWSLASGRLKCTLAGHAKAVTCARFLGQSVLDCLW